MGIWIICYGIANANLDAYLHWFEGQHTEEKLARPGYDWAAHYEVISGGLSDEVDHSFIAMFGARTSRVFYDPSPAQIKPNQDELTRTMIGHRIKPASLIVAEEWCEPLRVSGDEPSNREKSHLAVNSPVIRLGLFASDVDDQETGAWCAQTHFPRVADAASASCSRKLIASSGVNRHLIVEEYNDQAGADMALGAWADLAQSKLLYPPMLAKLRPVLQSNDS